MEASAFHPSNCVASDSTRSRCPAWVPWAKAAWACGISVLFLFFSDLTVAPMKSGGGEMSTTEVRKEPLWEEGISVHFSEKKSRSLILPRPPTGPLLPGSWHAAGILIGIDSDQSESVRCA